MSEVEPQPVILLVDDNPHNLAALQMALSREGYCVHTAADGNMALNLAASLIPNLILLDVLMPGMNGFDVCKQLKTMPALTDIPVIFISALGDTIDKVHGLQIGGVDYIIKPFEFEDVLARVKIHLLLQAQKREIEKRRQQDLLYFTRINELKRDLIDQVTHDLKNPLASIYLAVELVKRYGRIDDDKGRQYLDRIVFATQQMGNLITDMLDVVTLETGYSIRPQTIQLDSFVQAVLAAPLSNAEHKNIQLTLAYQNLQPDTWVSLDPEHINRALSNLLSNAIKYTPANGKIEVMVAQTDGRLQFTVADTGIGIPAEALPKLFQRFFRVNREASTAEGTGLGLYIVKCIVEQHGGSVGVESECGRGSKFTITLPLGA